MEIDIDKSFRKGIEVLNDLTELGDLSLFPLINHARYRMVELKEKSETLVNDLSVFKNIQNFINDSIVNMIHDYFLDKTYAQNITINFKENEGIGLKCYEKIVGLLPDFLTIINHLKAREEINFIVDNFGIRAKFCLDPENNMLEKREQIYALTRKALEDKCLITYFITTNEQVELFLNTSHSEQQLYGYDLNQTSQVYLTFTNVFEQYVCSNSYPNEIFSEHLCIEIDENLKVNKKVKRIKNIEKEKEILHFNFLFRPISLIIPKRGKIFPADSFLSNGLPDWRDTGSGKAIEKQDVYLNKTMGNLHIDFFSLISK
jgi:hypothetical protein